MEPTDFAGSSAPPSSPIGVTPAMTTALPQTRPWVFTLAVLMFIGCAFLVPGGAFKTILGLPSSGEPLPMAFGILLGLIYLVMAGVYFILARFLYRYGSNISSFLNAGGEFGSAGDATAALEAALVAQSSSGKGSNSLRSSALSAMSQ